MSEAPPPRGTRETRLLLLTLGVSVAVLFLLARFRFPERPIADLSPPQPLSRLTRTTVFDEMAATLADLLRQIGDGVVVVRMTGVPGLRTALAADAGLPPTALVTATDPSGAIDVPALRIRDNVAVALVAPDSQSDGIAADSSAAGTPVGTAAGAAVGTSAGSTAGAPTTTAAAAASAADAIIARDEERGLAAIRVPARPAPMIAVQPLAAALTAPGYVAIVEAAPDGPTIRAELITRVTRGQHIGWNAPVLILAGTLRTQPGALLFTLTGRFIGMALATDAGQTSAATTPVVPAELLLERANRLANGEHTRIIDTGVAIQALTPALARALGTTSGVIVRALHPRESGVTMTPGPPVDTTSTPATTPPATGPALAVGDVITMVDERAIRSPRDWREALRTRQSGRPITLSLVRFGKPLRATLVLPRPANAPTAAATAGAAGAASGAATGAASGARTGVATAATTGAVPSPTARAVAAAAATAGSSTAPPGGSSPSAMSGPGSETLGLSMRSRDTGTIDILAVQAGSPAARAGIAPGDRVSRILGASGPVNATTLTRTYAALTAGQALPLLIERPGVTVSPFIAAIEKR